MENASKALLIGASVLIAIVLISLGVKILGSAQGVTEQSKTTADIMTVATFNSQFESYVGNNVSGSQARSLISKVNVSNSKNMKQITLSGKTTMNDISPNKTYTITATYAEGYIATITIAENS